MQCSMDLSLTMVKESQLLNNLVEFCFSDVVIIVVVVVVVVVAVIVIC